MIQRKYELEYNAEEGVTLRFDHFSPGTSISAPAVVCIHGGGWVSGERESMHEMATHFASIGCAAFCVQYRLAPLHPYPVAVKDCQAFVRFLRRNASELGIDAQHICSYGESAGGYLAAMLALTDDDSSRVDAAIDVCGLTDLTNPKLNHPPISWDFINQFLAVPYEDSVQLWTDASPVYHVDSSAAPLLIFHGKRDDVVFVSQSERLARAMNEAGARCTFIQLADEGHNFSPSGCATVKNRSAEFIQEIFASAR